MQFIKIILEIKRMAVAIYLEPYGQTFFLSRDGIRTYFPGSLFAEVLELDPMTEVIPIPNPIVTPAVMQFLVNYSQGIEPVKHMPELVAVERYLNIPSILYYAEPLYDKIHRPIDILWTERDWQAPDGAVFSKTNYTVFTEALFEGRPLVIEYLVKNGFDVGGAYFYTREYHYNDVKNALLRLMIPTYEVNKSVIDAVMHDNLDGVKRLAQTPEAIEAAAIVAAYERKNGILEWILKTNTFLSEPTRHLISVCLAAYSEYYDNYPETGRMAGRYLYWLVQNRFL